MTLDTLPSTNFRIVVSVCIAAVIAIVLTVAVVLLHTDFNESQLMLIRYIGIGLLIMMGLDVTQFGMKRLTFKPDDDTPCEPSAPPSSATIAAPSPAIADDPNYNLPGVL